MSLPEYDPATELALLAAALHSPVVRQRARVLLTGADFMQPKSERVWNAMLDLDRRGIEVDPITLREALRGQGVEQLLVEVITYQDWVPSNGEHYAKAVRQWAVRRRWDALGTRIRAEVFTPVADAPGWPQQMARLVEQMAAVGETDDVSGAYAFELEAAPPKAPPWVMPDLLARGERMILTGTEGTGKSHLLRQVAVAAAGGLDPFESVYPFDPVRVTVLDYENADHHAWEAFAEQIRFVRQHGEDPAHRLFLDFRAPADITQDRVLSELHRVLEATATDLLVIGPLYHLAPEAIMTDTEATPLLGALDSLRTEHGCAILLEAHAPHGQAGRRDLRPRGSSALLGWPDFGFGVRWSETPGVVDVVSWRGARFLGRKWPKQLRRSRGRWVPV